MSPELSAKQPDWRDKGSIKRKDPGEKSKAGRSRRKSSVTVEVNSLKIDRCATPQPPASSDIQQDYSRHLYMPPDHINGNLVGRHLSGSQTNNNSLDYSHKNKIFWDDYRHHEYQRYHQTQHHQDQQQVRLHLCNKVL